jgi:carbon monoxide dehydrogenase subunit G
MDGRVKPGHDVQSVGRNLMEFDNSFEVPLPPAEAWKVLLDIERIAPCMPGAELTEVLGDNTYKGKIGVRLGPVALTFAGIVEFKEIDEATRTARVAAQGTDAKGRGGANAASTFRLEPSGSGSKVLVHTNLTLSGAVAQYGRGVGIIQATAAQLMNQFANSLKQKLAQEQPAAPAAAPAPPPIEPSPSIVPTAAPPTSAPPPPRTPAPAAKPISGFSLMAKVIWSWVAGLFRRP